MELPTGGNKSLHNIHFPHQFVVKISVFSLEKGAFNYRVA